MSDIILKADRVLVGEDLNLKEHMAVIVRDGKIEEIVPQAECPAVEGAEVIDLKNTTLMPGMIECHNHLSIDATIPEHLELLAWSTECELTLIALDGFRKDLMSGVTTARCMGDRFYIDVTLKKLIEQGKVAGPKLLAAGIGMKGSHGAGYIGSPHCGPEEIRKTARENLKKGVDLLKLFITPGVPDPEMNLGLKRKIAEAKANQVPADVIKRAIEKAKGGSGENYDSCRYEGFGPGAATIIIDCLTDNTNRSVSAVKTCFNKAHCKMGVAGCVSHSYDNVGLFNFPYEDEEGMLDALIMADVNVIDIESEDGNMTVTVDPTDFHKAKEAIDALIPEVEYDACEITMLPQEYVTLESEEDKESWNRLLTMLDDCDDVQKVYHNVEAE